MSAQEQLKSCLTLPNGLTLELWDCSRPVAGDRWQVVFEARINIPISENLPKSSGPPLIDQIKTALGPEVHFCQQKVRNFIAADQVQEVFEGLQARFLESTQAYLGHRDFPGKFILKKFSDYQAQQRYESNYSG